MAPFSKLTVLCGAVAIAAVSTAAVGAPKAAKPTVVAEEAKSKVAKSKVVKSKVVKSKVAKPQAVGPVPVAPSASAGISPADAAPRVSCAFARGACGFVDDAGRVVVQPDYDWAEAFAGGLARVKVRGRYGALDRFGRLAVAAEWDYLSPFVGGRAVAVVGGRHGVVDGLGQQTVAAKYAALLPLADGMYLADVSPPDAALDGGRLEVEEGRPAPVRALSGRWGVLRASDIWAVTPKFREVRPFAEGFAGGAFWGRPAHKWQLLSGRGEPLGAAVYDQVETASGGVAVVRTANQWNAIDATGRLLLPPESEAVRRRPDGLVSYQLAGRVGLVGREGRLAVPPKFDRIGTFEGDRARAERDGVVTWIGPNGETVAAPEGEAQAPPRGAATKSSAARGRIVTCEDGLLLKSAGSGWNFVDRKWHPVVDGTFAAARCFFRGTALVVRAGASRWIRIDRRGVAVDGPAFCRLPDYAADAAGTVGRQPDCRAEANVAPPARPGGGP